jgi:hypothetical protein
LRIGFVSVGAFGNASIIEEDEWLKTLDAFRCYSWGALLATRIAPDANLIVRREAERALVYALSSEQISCGA